MQIASILSDLTSLRVCDHSAALALVSTRAPASDTSAAGSVKQGGTVEGQPEDADVDLQRAMDLIDLHHAVKLKHMQGEDRGLMQARRDVDAVLAKLQRPAGEPLLSAWFPVAEGV
ncbi:MAG: hypothetical protein L6R39_005630 [Caloplaca ligustica]|nr:MAG: hypothetical protein L6R39_005630 [Caloplaca ligustica]